MLVPFKVAIPPASCSRTMPFFACYLVLAFGEAGQTETREGNRNRNSHIFHHHPVCAEFAWDERRHRRGTLSAPPMLRP
jgi:hypothetical protein